jgi:TRAP-type C4-dicarboxylate transport system substrate-binding protein
MRHIHLIATVLVGQILSAFGTSAQETQLRFATTNPPVVPLTRQVLHPWAEGINAAGKGAVSIEVIDGHAIANPGNYFDRISNDIMQIAWGLQGVLGDKYPLSALMAGAAIQESTELRSVAFWRLYKTGLLDSEYGDTVPFGLVAFPASAVHLREPAKSVDDLSGLKLIVADRLAGNMISRLRATPVALPLQNSYSALQRGVVDGLVIAWSAIAPFKLNEVTSFHIDAALTSGTGFVFMMRKTYDALPVAAKAVIDENSGEGFTRTFGAFWDDQIAQGRKLTENATPAHTIVDLSSGQTAKWQDAVDRAVAARAKEIPGGETVLAKYREIVRDLKAGK